MEVRAGGSREQRLDGTAKSLQVVVGKVAGMMDPATREATPAVTPGATTLTKTTGKTTMLCVLSPSCQSCSS